MSNVENLVNEFVEIFLTGDKERGVIRSREILSKGSDPLKFLETIFSPAMAIIGDRFGKLEIYLPELMTSADTAQTVSTDAIQPIIRDMRIEYIPTFGKVVLGSVKGDVHTIGKDMVGLMLGVNGFEVVDLGVNVPSHVFIDRARESNAEIIGLSSLMTTSMPYMREVVELRDGLGHKDTLSIIIGGAPITQEYCEEIGADAFGTDAVDAVNKCTELVNRRKTTISG